MQNLKRLKEKFARIVTATSLLAVCSCVNKDEVAQTQQRVWPDGLSVFANFGNQSKFFFGVATAPAHVEDNLNDAWLEYAKQGRVKAFSNQFEPEKRNLFWSNPSPELEIAQESGSTVLRMGIDWGRLVPNEPGSNACQPVCTAGIQDKQALARYKAIVTNARSRGLNIMMTLFHHSAPQWILKTYGWEDPRIVGYFETFARNVVKEFAADVDLWITINEPSAYLLLGHVAGMWPPGRTFTASTFLNLPGMQGPYAEAFDNMVNAHKRVYQAIHEIDKTVASPKLPNPAPAKVGIAHIGMVSHANSTLDVPSKLFFENLSKYGLLDNIANEMDFIGLNYYGAEFVKGTGVEIRDDKEYSESGRAIYPEGIFHILNDFNKRYNISHKNRTADASGKFRVIPFIITENGIADASDILRPAYTVEHLLAVHHAIQKGIPVEGYVAWTTSDNWEWLDGYCPKFGFAAVDRKNGFQRKLRDSFFLFQKIVAKGIITQGHRESAWEVVRENVGKPRPFCRAADGKSSLDVPTTRDIVDVDWRFRPPE